VVACQVILNTKKTAKTAFPSHESANTRACVVKDLSNSALALKKVKNQA